MERRHHLLPTPEVITCSGLHEVYTNMGTFMRKEALIYMTEMNRTGKESVMKGKRTNLQTIDGFVQIRTSSDFYLDPRDQQNIHFHHSSTLTKRDEEHTVTTDIPTAVS